MYIRREIAHRSRDSRVQRAAVRQMAAETHARRSDAAVACWEGQERGDGERGVFVVGGEFLCVSQRGSTKVQIACDGNEEIHKLIEVRRTFRAFSAFPLSVPGPSYANGSGPMNS